MIIESSAAERKEGVCVYLSWYEENVEIFHQDALAECSEAGDIYSWDKSAKMEMRFPGHRMLNQAQIPAAVSV
jgi:hypothetical protein